jgi:putative SOS response-associated peptidase YedK
VRPVRAVRAEIAVAQRRSAFRGPRRVSRRLQRRAQSRHAGRAAYARAETVSANKAYGPPYQRKQRCLVPASGFYEWQKTPAGKQPYFITSAGGELIAFAGLWEQWYQSGHEPLVTYTIITGRANALVAKLHDRMPVVLDPADYDRWLTDDDPSWLLQPYPPELMRAYPVSTRVNSPKIDDESLIECV